MNAVQRRCRLAFVRKALETRQTRQNLGYGMAAVANAFAIRKLGPYTRSCTSGGVKATSAFS